MPQVVVPLLLLLLRFLDRRLGRPVISEQLAHSLLDPVLDDDTLFVGIDGLLFDPSAVLDLQQLVTLEELEFLQLIEVVLLLLVDELDGLEVADDGRIDEEAVQHLLVGL